MRLSEKTIELTCCHQAGQFLGSKMVWFGLTQKQEANFGFDVCTKLKGRLLVIQFKASSKTLKRTKERQFMAHHDQMVNLRKLCRGRRAIYYAFPLVGTTAEIAANPDLLSQIWLLDVSKLPSKIPDPILKGGKGKRQSGMHYVNVKPGKARICSDEFEVELIKPKILFGEELNNSTPEIAENDIYGLRLESRNQYEQLLNSVSRNALGAILVP